MVINEKNNPYGYPVPDNEQQLKDLFVRLRSSKPYNIELFINVPDYVVDMAQDFRKEYFPVFVSVRTLSESYPLGFVSATIDELKRYSFLAMLRAMDLILALEEANSINFPLKDSNLFSLDFLRKKEKDINLNTMKYNMVYHNDELFKEGMRVYLNRNKVFEPNDCIFLVDKLLQVLEEGNILNQHHIYLALKNKLPVYETFIALPAWWPGYSWETMREDIGLNYLWNWNYDWNLISETVNMNEIELINYKINVGTVFMDFMEKCEQLMFKYPFEETGTFFLRRGEIQPCLPELSELYSIDLLRLRGGLLV